MLSCRKHQHLKISSSEYFKSVISSQISLIIFLQFIIIKSGFPHYDVIIVVVRYLTHVFLLFLTLFPGCNFYWLGGSAIFIFPHYFIYIFVKEIKKPIAVLFYENCIPTISSDFYLSQIYLTISDKCNALILLYYLKKRNIRKNVFYSINFNYNLQ